MGRPLKDIDPEKVVQYAALGCTYAEIAALLDVTHSTIERRFKEEFRKGREILKTDLRKWQIKSAKSGNVTMQIWLGKNLLGQTDNRHPEPPAKGKDEVVVK